MLWHVTVFSMDDRTKAAATLPVRADKQPCRIHEFGKVIADAICDGFVKNTFIAEGLEVKLQGFEFNTGARIFRRSWLKSDGDNTEVRVAGLGTDRSKFVMDVLDHERRVRGCGKSFEQGRIWHVPRIEILRRMIELLRQN